MLIAHPEVEVVPRNVENERKKDRAKRNDARASVRLIMKQKPLMPR